MPSAMDYYTSPDLYDAIYADITGDIPSWVAEAKAAGGPVLEIACGSGRVLVPCAEVARMDGLDATPEMLEACRAKLATRALTAELVLGDMRNFTLERRYALITIPFNSFLHNLTQADQITTLVCCREHLAPEGRLMFDVFHPDSRKLAEQGGTAREIKCIPHPCGRGSVRVTDATTPDPIEQIMRVDRLAEFLDETSAVTERHELSFELRYVYKPETELLLRAAGFARYQVRSRGSATAPLREGDPLRWTAWKS